MKQFPACGVFPIEQALLRTRRNLENMLQFSKIVTLLPVNHTADIQLSIWTGGAKTTAETAAGELA